MHQDDCAGDQRHGEQCYPSRLDAKNHVPTELYGCISLVATKCYMCYSRVMKKTITQRELRNDSGTVLREVQAGQTIIVTRNGVPVAELRPIPPRRFVPRAVIADAARRAPRVDAARLRADLDAVVDQSVDG